MKRKRYTEEQIDRLADQFELAFKKGDSPRIEGYIDAVSHRLKARLSCELVVVEVELRRSTGEEPNLGEYQRRFPECEEEIAKLLEECNRNGVPSATVALEDSEKVGLDSPDDEPLPDKLGRYEVKRLLGQGGFGVVCLAYDPELKRDVAIKIPRKKWSGSKKQVELLVEEGQRGATLRHPGLVAVYDAQKSQNG